MPKKSARVIHAFHARGPAGAGINKDLDLVSHPNWSTKDSGQMRMRLTTVKENHVLLSGPDVFDS